MFQKSPQAFLKHKYKINFPLKMPRANAEGIPIIKILLLFQLQQILLHLHAIGVAGELAGAAHHPVAGLKDGDGVAVAGTAHGTAGLGFANSGGQLAVGAGLTVGDLVHLGPDGLLEGGALGGQRQIEFPARPGKIFVQLLLGFL